MIYELLLLIAATSSLCAAEGTVGEIPAETLQFGDPDHSKRGRKDPFVQLATICRAYVGVGYWIDTSLLAEEGAWKIYNYSNFPVSTNTTAIMSRQKAAEDNDSYLLDTDGYLITSGCYYKIRLPDRREMGINQARSGGYYGPVGVAPANGGDLFWINAKSWATNQAVDIGVLNLSQPQEEHWLSDGEGELGYGKDTAAMPFYGHKVPGQNRNFIWEEYMGRIYVSGQDAQGYGRVLLQDLGDTKKFMGSFEVEFVYVRDR